MFTKALFAFIIIPNKLESPVRISTRRSFLTTMQDHQASSPVHASEKNGKVAGSLKK
jgi:hypothetical protein